MTCWTPDAGLFVASLIVAYCIAAIFRPILMPDWAFQIVFAPTRSVPYVLWYGLGFLWLGMFVFATVKFGESGLWLLIGAPGGLLPFLYIALITHRTCSRWEFHRKANAGEWYYSLFDFVCG